MDHHIAADHVDGHAVDGFPWAPVVVLLDCHTDRQNAQHYEFPGNGYAVAATSFLSWEALRIEARLVAHSLECRHIADAGIEEGLHSRRSLGVESHRTGVSRVVVGRRHRQAVVDRCLRHRRSYGRRRAGNVVGSVGRIEAALHAEVCHVEVVGCRQYELGRQVGKKLEVGLLYNCLVD